MKVFFIQLSHVHAMSQRIIKFTVAIACINERK